MLNTAGEVLRLRRVELLTSTSKRVSPNKTAIFRSFLPAMASSHTSMNYNKAALKNRRVHNFARASSSARTCWRWAGPKLHSLLSAHHLIGAYFLTTESDKRMRLLTRLYGISAVPHSEQVPCWIQTYMEFVHTISVEILPISTYKRQQRSCEVQDLQLQLKMSTIVYTCI